jgi:Helix-turn-helix domain
MAGVIEMSDRELTRLRVMIDLADDRLTVDAAATLMGLGRRQIYRLRRIFSADGPAGLASRKRGRPSNRKRGETFRATVLSLVESMRMSGVSCCLGLSGLGRIVVGEAGIPFLEERSECSIQRPRSGL